MPRRSIANTGASSQINRRQWLAALGVGGATALAGCNTGGDGDDGGDGGDGSDGSDGGDGSDGDDGGSEIDDDLEELPEVSGTYNSTVASPFTTLNPIYNDENSAGTAIGYALDMGYTFDDNNEYFPLLYDMSTENGEVWTFEVREGLEFSEPYGSVTAEDFVYLIQEIHQAEWSSSVAATDWAGVEVEQTGEYEFQATLSSPEVLWPESYAPLLYPIPKDLIQPYVEEEDTEGLEQDEELLELSFAGNLGAYVLDEWERSAATRYTRNEDYYLRDVETDRRLFDNAPYFEELEISVVEEQSSRLGALETGESDTAEVPPERVEEFRGLDNVDVLEVPTPYNSILSVNMRDNGWMAGPGNLFRYKEMRQAINASINKDEIIEGIYRGFAAPHYTWQPRWSNFYPGDDAITKFGSGDQATAEFARGLVEEAVSQSEYDYGYDGDTLLDPDGNQVLLELCINSGSETQQLLAEYMQEQFSNKLGIDLEINAMDPMRFDSDYWSATPPEDPTEEEMTDTVNGEEVTWENQFPSNPGPRSFTSAESWDMSTIYGLNTYPLNPLTNEVFFDGADCQYNPVGYYPEFDVESIFEDARQATSSEELGDAMHDLFVNLAEEQPYIMLTFGDDTTGYTSSLQGPIENFMNGWDFPAWYFEE